MISPSEPTTPLSRTLGLQQDISQTSSGLPAPSPYNVASSGHLSCSGTQHPQGSGFPGKSLCDRAWTIRAIGQRRYTEPSQRGPGHCPQRHRWLWPCGRFNSEAGHHPSLPPCQLLLAPPLSCENNLRIMISPPLASVSLMLVYSSTACIRTAVHCTGESSGLQCDRPGFKVQLRHSMSSSLWAS